MAAKRHKAEEIVTKLCQVDVLHAQGKPMAEAIRSIGVTEVTYYRCRAHDVLALMHNASRFMLATAPGITAV